MDRRRLEKEKGLEALELLVSGDASQCKEVLREIYEHRQWSWEDVVCDIERRNENAHSA